MTVDVEAPRETERSPRSPTTTRFARAALGTLASAPDRLLLVSLCFAYVVAAASTIGVFRAVVVLPASAVVAVVVLATWRPFRDAPAPDGRAALGAALALAAVVGWVAANLPYVAERVVVTRDPDIYTLTALWMVDHPSPSIPVPAPSLGSLGFPLQDGALRPQGNSLVSAVSATLGWLFGEDAVYAGGLLGGALALLALYVLARAVLGPLWGLVPMLAMAGSLPMLQFSRALYSEPLALTFTLLGAALLWRAWQRDSVPGYVGAGLGFGAVALARIDGSLPLIGVLTGLAVAALVRRDGARGGRRWAAPLVLLGSLPGVLLGFADLWWHSGSYVQALSSQLQLLAAGFVAATLFALLASLVNADRRWRPALRTLVSWAAIAGAVLSGAAFAFMATRPWWMVSRGDLDNGLVRGIQEREGLGVDGTRLYAEESLQWIAWYYGWPVLVVGLLGLVAWLAIGARERSARLLWLSALVLPSTLLYLWQPSITPDQIWAMRRFLPVVVPGLLLATTWVARELSVRRAVGAAVAAVLTVATVVWPLTATRHMAGAGDKEGAVAGTDQVCDLIDGRPTIVTGVDTYLPTVLVLCDVTAISLHDPTPERLAEARERLGGGPVVLVTRAPGQVPWVGEPPPQQTWRQEVWEQSLTGPPDEVFEEVVGVSIGVVGPDGFVDPISP